MAIFQKHYAQAYDILYETKDYQAECTLIEKIFQQYGQGSIKDILDLGCGTGNHVIPLAQQGYTVTGVDLSAEMLQQAEEKLRDNGDLSVQFLQGDIKNIQIPKKFDAVIMMFAVLGYQYSNDDLRQALKTVKDHLKPEGIFIFDAWYGPAVLKERPSDRLRVWETSQGRLYRFSSGVLNTNVHQCEVSFRLWQLQGTTLMYETEETHQVRYFFPLELDLALENAGLKLLTLGQFPDFSESPSEENWNILGVARA